jgi:hypothetical protein
MIAEVSARLYPALETRLVSAYLSSKGWQAAKEAEGITWSHREYPDQLIFHSDGPIAPELAQQLAAFEHRAESSVLAELRHADADLLRIVPPGAGPDTLLLEQGNRLLRGVQRLLTAAARTVMEPMPSLVGKKPREVTAYLHTLKLGMAEPEAYTLTVLSPLREADQESLARQTLLKLATTLHELQFSIGPVLADADMRRGLVTGGLSAELCDALTLMMGGSPRKSEGNEAASRSLTLQFVWSPLLLPPAGTVSSLTFEPDLAENIKALADLLRETVPQEGFQLQGTISDLKRAHHAGTGKVIVQNITGEQPDKVSLELEEDLYTLAIQAHQLQTPVLCVGALTKKGKTYELLNASLAPAETLTAAD